MLGFVVPFIVAVPIWVRFGRRYGKGRCFAVANGICAAAFVMIGLFSSEYSALSLVGLLTLMGRLLGPAQKPEKTAPARHEASAAPPASSTESDDDELLRGVALAAFALHQSHRIRVRGAEPATAWGDLARVRALRAPTS